MFDRYDVGGTEFTLVEWSEAPSEDHAGPAARAMLFAALESDAVGRSRLRRWLHEAGFDLTHDDELHVLEAAVESGRVVVLAADAIRSVAGAVYYEPTLSPEVEAAEPEPEPEHDWIEIELTDEDDVPIQGAGFELTMPDGTVRRGSTNERGRFFVPRTDSGQCQLRWMRLHRVERAPQFVAAVADAAADGA